MAMIKLGAVGIEGSEKWDHGGRTRITQIVSSYSAEHLYSLQFTYLNEDGASFTTETVGSPDFPGDTHKVITFEGGNEFIERVEGDYKTDSGPGIVIRRLKIHTNVDEYLVVNFEQQSQYPPFIASWSYKKFGFDFGRSKQFAGFYGSQGANGAIISIGVYLNSFQLLRGGVVVVKGDKDDASEDSA